MPDLVAPEAKSSGLKIMCGMFTTVTASDTVATGLRRVLYAYADFEDPPVLGADRCFAAIGNQSGAPPAGSILIKTYKPTLTTDTTPVVATTFSRQISWLAVGF